MASGHATLASPRIVPQKPQLSFSVAGRAVFVVVLMVGCLSCGVRADMNALFAIEAKRFIAMFCFFFSRFRARYE
jgi:hypothetical protein